MAYAVIGAIIVGILMVFFGFLTPEDESWVGALAVTGFIIALDIFVSVIAGIVFSTFDDELFMPASIATFIIGMFTMGFILL